MVTTESKRVVEQFGKRCKPTIFVSQASGYTTIMYWSGRSPANASVAGRISWQSTRTIPQTDVGTFQCIDCLRRATMLLPR